MTDPEDLSPLQPLPASESYSSLTAYETCPRRYAFRYVERVPGEVRPAQFAFGNAIHKAFEIFVRGRIRARLHDGEAPDAAGEPVGAPHAASEARDAAGEPVGAPDAASEASPAIAGAEAGDKRFSGADLEDLRRVCDLVLEGAGLEPAELDEARSRAEPALVRFLAREAASRSTSVAAELGFGVDVAIPGEAVGVRFVGYVDRLDRAPDGSIEVLDYKTGRARSQADVDVDRQLTAYAYACARGAMRDPATGGPLPAASRLALYFADSGVEVATARTDGELAAFEGDLVAMVAAVRRRSFDARPETWRCRWCEYRVVCPAAATRA